MPRVAGFPEVVGAGKFEPGGYAGGRKYVGDGRYVGGGGQMRSRLRRGVTIENY